MSKRFPVARWALPATVAPSTSTCYMIPVPDDPNHVAAFKGAIYELAKAYSWGNDDAHTAKDVAAVWLDIFNNLELCNPLVQFRQPDICTLEVSFDGGSTWSEIYNAETCVTNGVNDGIQQRLDDGTLMGGGQQPGQGSGTPGQCYDFDISLAGNNKWNSPVAVEAGDLITISAVEGAWSDTNGLANIWYCGDGGSFLLGVCSGGGTTMGGDPATAENHMRLVGNIPGAAVDWFDAYNAAYTVPAGVVLSALFLQANDSDLTDNQGSINLHIQICKSTWTHVFDFLTGDGGFVTANPTYTHQYTSGVGWETTSTEPGMNLVKTVPADCNIIYAELSYHCDALSGIPDRIVDCYTYLNPIVNTFFSAVPSAGDNAISGNGSQVNPASLYFSLVPGHTGNYAKATRLEVRGTGYDPF